MKKHLHFLIWAYEQKDGDNFKGVVHIDIICKNQEEALSRAKQLLPNYNYRIQSIIEHFDSADNLGESSVKRN
jgi:hypothetical protein